MKNNDLMQYEANRDLMKTGDLIEFRANTVLGWLIRKFTKKTVNHTAIVICLPYFKEIEDPHVYIMEACYNGMELNLLSHILREYDGEAYWKRLSATGEQRGRMQDFALEQDGKPYDYKGLFKNAVGAVNADARAYFCSEFAFIALRKAGIVSGDKAPVPGDFDKFGCFKPGVRLI